MVCRPLSKNDSTIYDHQAVLLWFKTARGQDQAFHQNLGKMMIGPKAGQDAPPRLVLQRLSKDYRCSVSWDDVHESEKEWMKHLLTRQQELSQAASKKSPDNTAATSAQQSSSISTNVGHTAASTQPSDSVVSGYRNGPVSRISDERPETSGSRPESGPISHYTDNHPRSPVASTSGNARTTSESDTPSLNSANALTQERQHPGMTRRAMLAQANSHRYEKEGPPLVVRPFTSALSDRVSSPQAGPSAQPSHHESTSKAPVLSLRLQTPTEPPAQSLEANGKDQLSLFDRMHNGPRAKSPGRPREPSQQPLASRMSSTRNAKPDNASQSLQKRMREEDGPVTEPQSKRHHSLVDRVA